MPPAQRQSLLVTWALQALGETSAATPAVTPVAGDASSRRYFRLRLGERSFIAVDAPPATEKNAAFVAVRDLLAAAGVRVPRVIALNIAEGFLLLEDLGDTLLLTVLSPDSVDDYYQQAMQLLHRLAAVDPSQLPLPHYDKAVLSEELSRFAQWFVERLLGHPIQPDEGSLLEDFSQLLIDSALAQPQVLVHRDFHSRNLMLLEGGGFGVIDFQDALIGPLTYDLVSLLRDCYVEWPAARVEQWALGYRAVLAENGRLPLADERQFTREFDLMGLQRHIKVLGTFARLYLRDGKEAYLADLPRVLRYTHAILERYAGDEAVFASVLQWFDTTLLPLAAQQRWSASQ